MEWVVGEEKPGEKATDPVGEHAGGDEREHDDQGSHHGIGSPASQEHILIGYGAGVLIPIIAIMKVPDAIRVEWLPLNEQAEPNQIAAAWRLAAGEVIVLPRLAVGIGEVLDVIGAIEPTRFVGTVSYTH